MAGSPSGIQVGISRLHHPVLVLGPGRRIGIWFQGCSIGCAGCMSRDTWDSAGPDDVVPLEAVTDWVADIDPTEVDGITISGGEPFDQPEALGALTRWLRARFNPSSVDILVYSGYPQATLEGDHREVLATLDAVVTEPYRQNAAGAPRRWRGSSNQRLVTLSSLGRRRYAEHLEAPADTGMQVDVHDGEVRLIGVPRPGDLRRIEESLARRGVALSGSSWTRPGTADR